MTACISRACSFILRNPQCARTDSHRLLLFHRRTAQEGRSRDGCDLREISTVRNIVQKPCFLCLDRSRQTLWSVRRSTNRYSILAMHLSSPNLHEQMLFASMWQNLKLLLSFRECGTCVDHASKQACCKTFRLMRIGNRHFPVT